MRLVSKNSHGNTHTPPCGHNSADPPVYVCRWSKKHMIATPCNPLSPPASSWLDGGNWCLFALPLDTLPPAPPQLSLVPRGRVKSAISISWLARHLCLLLQLSGLPNERESGDQRGTANTDTHTGRVFVFDFSTEAQIAFVWGRSPFKRSLCHNLRMASWV